MPSAVAFDPQLLAIAEDAYIWGFPRMIFAEYLSKRQNISAPFNRFMVATGFTRTDQKGASLDFLYGIAWLDLADEPVVLEVPDAQGRYYSIQMQDVYANNFAYVGRRVTGTKAGRYLIAGPDWKGQAPAGISLIRSPSRSVMCYLRTLIDGEADLPIVNAFNTRVAIGPLSAYPMGQLAALPTENLQPYALPVFVEARELGAQYFDRLGDALASDPPTDPRDIKLMSRFAGIGIGPGLHPAQDPARVALLTQAAKNANRKIDAADVNTAIGGWAGNLQVNDFIEDPLFKAGTNRFGPAVPSKEEAIHFVPEKLTSVPTLVPSWTFVAPDGKPLAGDRNYRLHFPAGQLPPVDAFWSLAVYGVDWLMYQNAIGRYSIRDTMPGLKYGADGSLDLLIQHERPADGDSNWLPTPKDQYRLHFRAYQPRREFFDGSYRLPALEIVG